MPVVFALTKLFFVTAWLTTDLLNKSSILQVRGISLTPATWSNYSKTGQADIPLVTSATACLYECLAISYCIKADSHLVKQQIKRDNEAMTNKFIN